MSTGFVNKPQRYYVLKVNLPDGAKIGDAYGGAYGDGYYYHEKDLQNPSKPMNFRWWKIDELGVDNEFFKLK